MRLSSFTGVLSEGNEVKDGGRMGGEGEAVILHRGSFRRECGEGLGCHPSQGVVVEGMGGEG